MSAVSKRASDADLILQEDTERSIEQWKTLDAMSLKLKCNTYNLSCTGRKDALATRLFEHFHAAYTTPSPQASSDSEQETHPDDILDLTVPDADELIYEQSVSDHTIEYADENEKQGFRFRP